MYDNSIIDAAENKATKVVAPLLKFLPGRFQYKIVFMTRDINEILTSQDKMLQANKKMPERSTSLTFSSEYKQILKNTFFVGKTAKSY